LVSTTAAINGSLTGTCLPAGGHERILQRIFVGDPPGLHEVNEDLLAFLKSRGAGTTTAAAAAGDEPLGC